MQYDENGYPIKGRSNNHNSYPQNTAAVASSSSAAASSPSQQHPSPYQQQQQQSAGLQYDERGYPVKQTQQQQPQQQRNQPHQPGQPRYDERGYPIKSHRNDQREMTLPVANQHQHHQQEYPPAVHYPPAAHYPPLPQGHNNQILGTQISGPVLQPYALQPPPINYWSTGLCDIGADFDVCIEGTCCLCCEEGRIYDALENNEQDSMNPFACCVSFVCCFFFCLPVINVINRRSIVEKYNLQDENCCITLCFSCLCPCCSSCQIHRELQLRGVYPGGVCCAPGKNPNATVL